MLVEHPGEEIDLFSGQLRLHHVDVEIPGSGGFALRVERTYKLHTIEAFEPFGITWLMHFGRLKTGSSECGVPGADALMEFELPDGRVEAFFKPAQGIGIAGSPRKLSPNLWRIDCITPTTNSGYVVVSPEGTRYQLDVASYGGVSYLYPSAISDRHGNRFNLTYFYPFNNSGQALIKTITSSDGRSVTFNYTPGFLLDNITTGEGRTWKYSYQQIDSGSPSVVYNYFQLMIVTRPDGSTLKYDYYGPGNPNNALDPKNASVYHMKTVTYPWNGTINYEYTYSTVNGDSALYYFSVIQKKTTSDGGVWSFVFKFANQPNVQDITTVTTPSGIVTAEHYGYNSVPVDECWKSGLPTKKTISPSTGAALETQTFSWGSSLISNAQTSRPLHTASVCFGISQPRLTQKQIVREGNAHTTAVLPTDFDPYGNPTKVTESSVGPPAYSRTKTLAPQVSITSWILHQLDKQTHRPQWRYETGDEVWGHNKIRLRS